MAKTPLLLAFVMVAAMATTTVAQPAKLTIGMYAPSAEFTTAHARLTYVQSLAKAIQASTGITTEAQLFASLGALKAGRMDFAIIDSQCYASHLGWKLLANADIGGTTTRMWALYASTSGAIQTLRGKKLAFVQVGCNDRAFIDNAMFESEIDDGFFVARVGKADLPAAVAEVTSLRGAQAVLAPAAAYKDLTKVFDAGVVPNPGFVQISSVSTTISAKVASAVIGFTSKSVISGWKPATTAPYHNLAARMRRTEKRGLFAPPQTVRVDIHDVVLRPPTLDQPAPTDVLQHVSRPPERLE